MFERFMGSVFDTLYPHPVPILPSVDYNLEQYIEYRKTRCQVLACHGIRSRT